MIGKTLIHYEVLRKIGSGGMGEVYLARDTKLNREVALKVLPADKAVDPVGRDRFEREAQAVASLKHPNIVTIHAVEQADDVHFLVMELVEGHTLSYLIPDGGFSTESLLEMAIPLADAVAYAHTKGITHRDLKPANVMLDEDNRVKVLDFGLARLIDTKITQEAEATQLLTPASMNEAGLVVGTVPYMSPEQLRGGDVDERTDIFSLGVLLYEMAAGRKPFLGVSNMDVMSAILRDTPPRVTAIRAELPDDLGRIVHRCLEKMPEDRYQTAKELGHELEALDQELKLESTAGHSISRIRTENAYSMATTARLPLAEKIGSGAHAALRSLREDSPSIAVLPFVNMSQEAENEYFSDGLSEELLDALAKVRGIRVASRTSAFTFKGRNVDIATAARKLNVGHILEGSVRRAGTRVRITAQLIDAATDSHLWSESYNRELEDIFAVQEEIAQSVVQELKGVLLGEDAAATRARGENAEAHSLFLQGRYFFERLGREDLRKAVDYFEQSLAADPVYAPAWVGLARATASQAAKGWVPSGDAYRRARESAQKALELDSGLAEAHAVLGLIRRSHDWDWPGADSEYQRALKLEPGNAYVLRVTGGLAAVLGRLEEGIALIRRAGELDPLSVRSHVNLAGCLYCAGRLEQAEQSLKKALELNPEQPVVRQLLGRVYLRQERMDLALEQMERESDEGYRLYGLARVYRALGRDDEAEGALARLIDEHGESLPVQIAGVYANWGQKDAAFEWLNRAIVARDAGVVEMKISPEFRSLHDDARWGEFLGKIGLAG